MSTIEKQALCDGCADPFTSPHALDCDGPQVWMDASGRYRVTIRADFHRAAHVAKRALFLEMAWREQQADETIIAARQRIRAYLEREPLVEVPMGENATVREWCES